MENTNLSYFKFYESLFDKEIERSKYYDKIIQFPTTVIFVLIGGAFYSFNFYFKDKFGKELISIDWIYIMLSIAFTIGIIITIFLLFKVFHGFTRIYLYLPYSNQLEEREKELLKFVEKNKEEFGVKTESDLQNEAKSLFINDLIFYYKEYSNANQLINDNRAKNYARARNFIFFDIILFIILGIIGLIFQFV
jgi:hypothetical protein